MNRVLFVIESLFELGPAQQLVALVKELAERGCEIHIGVIELFPGEHVPWEEVGATVHSLGNHRFTSPVSRSSFQAVLQLRKLIQKIRPDVVHGWCGISQWLTLAGTEIGPRSTKRFMTELSLQPEKQLVRQMYENRSSSGFDQFFVSHASVQQQLVSGGCESNRIQQVPNRVSPPEVDRAKGRQRVLEQFNLPSDTRIAGTVAPLVPRTRIKDLIWATDLLACVREDVHFVIVGTGHQKSRLQKFASQTEAGHHVHFLDTPSDATNLLAGLDFFWQSHLQEPLPSNLMLAMALAIPVISVFGPGTSEIIRHQETGFAVNLGARDEYARWTKYLIELPEAAQKLSRQGQQYVLGKFRDRRHLQPYLSAYELSE